MDKTQAEAITQAILEPDRRFHEELVRKRAAEAEKLARQRRVAWLILAGAAIGVTVAHFIGVRFTAGIAWGAISGGLVGTVVTRRAA